MKHRKIACCAALVAVALVAALPALAADGKPWRHGIIEPKSDAGILTMIKNGGFAEKQGLNLELVNIQSDQIGLKALLSGDLDSYEGGPSGVLVADSRGADAKILGCHWPVLPHGIFTRAGIASVQDLKGKSFAISAPGALPDLIVRAVLQKNGIGVDDVRLASLGSDVDRFKALAAGVVDAAVISNEYVPIADAQNIKLLMYGREALPYFMRICQFSSAKALAQRPDDAVRFVAAEISALRFAMTHRDETIALSREVTKTKPEDPRAAFVYDEAVSSKSVDPEMALPMDKLSQTQDLMMKSGNMTKPIDIAKAIDESVRLKALALLAK
ncbi:MAG: transporter substrate-binding protein [Rhodospirillales bacterium]|jgi:NitT/TauT family transport system substrate-binding protein|nr:transporter substrate-binding protein [Rhodospirillales bacterium]